MKNALRKYWLPLLILLMLIGLSIPFLPWAKQLADPETRAGFALRLRSLGAWTIPVMLFFQILQIVVAVIPGEPFELLAGALFGTFGGLAICLLGCAIASVGVFFFSRRYGRPLLRRFFKDETLDRFSFLESSKKLETVTFLLFLIPGTPKDVLTWLAGTTPIAPGRFLTLTLLARIPSVLSSTCIADSALSGSVTLALVVTGATLAVGLIGIMFGDRLTEKIRNRGQN